MTGLAAGATGGALAQAPDTNAKVTRLAGIRRCITRGSVYCVSRAHGLARRSQRHEDYKALCDLCDFVSFVMSRRPVQPRTSYVSVVAAVTRSQSTVTPMPGPVGTGT